MSAALRLRLILPLTLLGVLLALTALAGAGLARALQRPVEYRYFDEALGPTPTPTLAVTWAQGTTLNRRFGKVEEFEVARALTEAWALHAAALATGDTAYLADRFSGTALTRATLSAQGAGVRMVVLHHRARPLAFHMDGSVLQVADAALTARFTLREDGTLDAYRLTLDDTVTTLINEASGWHILSHERHGAASVEPPPPPHAAGAVLAGVNYYPAATPWGAFWPRFDLSVIQADLARIRGLGGNAVRIFLQREDFLNPDQAPANLRNLALFLQAAQAQGIAVVPTLFDLRGGYEPSLWANDHVALQAVLPVLAAAPNVAFVDLKNEPDLDYARHGKGTVQAWLMTMAAASRRIAPELALTVGWSNAGAATEMAGLVDVVTYHDYAPADQTADRFATVTAAAAGKPVMVTEIGQSSWTALLGLPSSPQAQAEALTRRGQALRGAAGLFVWTLHDFAKIDTAVIGPSPWAGRLQAHFGLFDGAGREKPAAAATRSLFHSLLKGNP